MRMIFAFLLPLVASATPNLTCMVNRDNVLEVRFVSAEQPSRIALSIPLSRWHMIDSGAKVLRVCTSAIHFAKTAVQFSAGESATCGLSAWSHWLWVQRKYLVNGSLAEGQYEWIVRESYRDQQHELVGICQNIVNFMQSMSGQ